MGVVYKGFDPQIQRPVAIKVIHKELLGDDSAQTDATARFRNEAQAVGRIMHPGIVAIYEFGEDDAAAFIAMEYVEGQNLDQVLKTTPLIDAGQAHQIMGQLLDALHQAHQVGVWHRDIKPANLILTHSGQLKLTDFGIARIAGMGLTQVASSIGTPGFMAPEQYLGEGVDQRCDVFAAGALYYRLLTGVPAFAGAQETVMYKIFNEQPLPVSQVQPQRFPQALDAVVNRALAKKLDDRFATAMEFKNAIRDVLRAGHYQPPPATEKVAENTLILKVEDRAQALREADPPAAFDVPAVLEPTPMPVVAAPTPAVRAVTTPEVTPLEAPSSVIAVEPTPLALPEPVVHVVPTMPITPVAEAEPQAKVIEVEVPVPPIEHASTASTANTAISVIAGWDPEVLAQITQRLANRVGPMAKIMVRNAARDCLDLGSLTGALSQHIEEPGERARFLNEVAPPPAPPTQVASPSPSAIRALADPLTEAHTALAQKIVTRVLGPIARVMVKRAADKARDRTQFIELLLAAMEADDQAAVKKELHSLR